jgi:hypothetical protein
MRLDTHTINEDLWQAHKEAVASFKRMKEKMKQDKIASQKQDFEKAPGILGVWLEQAGI